MYNNVHTLDIIKSNVMVYVLYLRLIYYIHVVCILLSMEGQISMAINCIFTVKFWQRSCDLGVRGYGSRNVWFAFF